MTVLSRTAPALWFPSTGALQALGNALTFTLPANYAPSATVANVIGQRSDWRRVGEDIATAILESLQMELPFE